MALSCVASRRDESTVYTNYMHGLSESQAEHEYDRDSYLLPDIEVELSPCCTTNLDPFPSPSIILP
jgi:hypothetical protein